MGEGESKQTVQSTPLQEANTYDELVEQVEEVERLSQKYMNPKDHCRIECRIEPSRNTPQHPHPQHSDDSSSSSTSSSLPGMLVEKMWKSFTRVFVKKVPTLPPFWESRLTDEGQVFYVDHTTQSTHWEAPWSIPHAPVVAGPLAMTKCLTFRQWTWAYTRIKEAVASKEAELSKSQQALLGLSSSSSSITLPSSATTTTPTTASSTTGGEEQKKEKKVTMVLKEEPELRECVVCMERKPAIVLPCTHCFCQKCLDEWKSKGMELSTACPLCRTVGRPDDEWVLASEPTDEELATYLSHFLEVADEFK